MEAYGYISEAAFSPLSSSAVQAADAVGNGLWFTAFAVAVALPIACIVISILVSFGLAQESFLPTTAFSKRDRQRIGRLVLPETAVRTKSLEDMHTKPRFKRLYEAAFGARHNWSDFELMISDGAWADDFSPILVFVNTRSGGRQGAQVLMQLHTLLHDLQVVNLQAEAPEAALQWWSCNVKKYRILVCGGDGTVGWVLGALETLKLDYMPPVSILPLGTGNDLSRVLGWGVAFQGGGIIAFLRQVAEARVSLLDRWTVVCRDLVPQKQRWRKSSPSTPASEQQSRRERQHLSMNNYFGIGLDAAIALDFHRMRERRPELFFSRMVNKMWYARNYFLGHWGLLRRTCTKLHSKVTIVCDGVPLKIPTNMEGVVILNIQSFGGGTNLWGGGEESEDSDAASSASEAQTESEADSEVSAQPQALFVRPSAQDQRLEVVGLTSLRLGAAQVGLAAAKRLAQAKTIKIYNQASLPMQVDGEPFVMEEGGEIELSWKGEAFMLARTSEQADTIATDVIDWALQRSIIDVKQRNELMKETARRMQVNKMTKARSASRLSLIN
jgi:diacylglycerol kinase (ATP)